MKKVSHFVLSRTLGKKKKKLRVSTLDARDFSSAVSGFCQVFIVTRAKHRNSCRTREKPLVPRVPSVRRLQQCEPLKPRTNGSNIVGCYMLRPFAHPVACCVFLGVVTQSLKPPDPCKQTQHCSPTTPNIFGSCCVRFHLA